MSEASKLRNEVNELPSKQRSQTESFARTPNTQNLGAGTTHTQSGNAVNRLPESFNVNTATNSEQNFTTHSADFQTNNGNDFKVNFDEMNEEQQQEHALLHNVLPGEIKSAKKVAKIDKPFKDPDSGRPDTSPIKIDQGDIIEYMMKEIILEGAGYIGGWVSGWVGYGAYQGCSLAYHKIYEPCIKKPIKKGANKIGKSAEKAWSKLLGEDKKDRVDYVKNLSADDENSFKSWPEDDRTTQFAKLIGANHFKERQQIESNRKQNKEIYKSALLAAANGNLDKEIKVKIPETDEEKTYPNIDSVPGISKEKIKALKEIQEQIKSKPQLAESYKKNAENTAETWSATQAMEDQFILDYSAASMIREKQENKDFCGKEININNLTPEQDRAIGNEWNLRKAEATKIFLKGFKENHSPNKEISPEYQEFLGKPNQAYNKVLKDINRGNYNENERTPSENKDLDELNQTVGLNKKQEEKTEEKPLNEAKLPESKSITKNEEINEEIKALGAEKEANDNKRTWFTSIKNRIKNREKLKTPENSNNIPRSPSPQTFLQKDSGGR